jgi:hypothetical protein
LAGQRRDDAGDPGDGKMAFAIYGRVLEESVTTGTGTYTLAGAVEGYRAFSDAYTDADTVHYWVSMGAGWEEGYGTYSAGTLARTTIIKSSNSNNAVNWGTGTKLIGVGPLGPSDLDATNKARVLDTVLPFTTRGDLLRRGASASERFALGASTTLLGSDGTDAVWKTAAAVLADMGALGKFPFPATQVPSAGANDLDDYEEGTFSPGTTFGGAAVGLTYGTQYGGYRKIGSVVMVWVRVVLTAKGSSTGTALITGLPFTNGAPQRLPVATRFTAMTSGVGDTTMAANVDNALTTVTLYKMAAGSIAALTDADFTNTSDISIGGTYHV